MIDNIEMNILGACFNAGALHDILQQVSVDDFSTETYKKTFIAIEAVAENGAIPDAVVLKATDDSLGVPFLMELQDDYFLSSNIDYLLSKFREYADKTKYLRMAKTVSSMAGETSKEIRAVVESSLESKQQGGAEHIKKPLNRAMKLMEDAFNNKGRITGIPTGIGRIDREMSGLHKTDMVLVAARPSIGKTALALQIADYACVMKKIPTLFISLEMSSEQLSSRLILSRSKICVSKARNGLFEESDWQRLTDSAGLMASAPLYVDDCCGVTIDTIVAKAKSQKMKNNIGLLIIDYLGLVSGSGTEYERVTEASRKTKMLAKQLNIPVVALHQLNRGNVTNGEKARRPTMSDLRSSGQLEQDADVILLLHREKNEAIEPCEIIVEKNRHGNTGAIKMQWNGPINRIEQEVGDYGQQAANY